MQVYKSCVYSVSVKLAMVFHVAFVLDDSKFPSELSKYHLHCSKSGIRQESFLLSYALDAEFA